jgi:tRNA nucleotidyltransferase/poly(A) polymerase
MLKAVAEILGRRGTAGWLVGGSVRDRLLGSYSPDLDIVVSDDAVSVAEQLAETLRSPWFALSGRHPAYRILGTDGHVDVAEVRGDILTDLGLRDFTVNAMAVPVESAASDGWPSAGGGRGAAGASVARGASTASAPALGILTVLDPFGGMAHLQARRLVPVSKHIFADDPVRLMRAPRFCHTLGLRLDADLARTIREQATSLAGAAAERIVSEMCLTFAVGRAADAARLWDELGLLTVVLPELGAGGGSRASAGRPDGVPAVGAAVRADRSATLSLLERLDVILERPAEGFPEAEDLLAARLAKPIDGAVTRPVGLRLAGLTYGLGANDVRALCRRLKLSGAMDSLLGAIAKVSSPKASNGKGKVTRPRSLRESLPGDAAVGRPAVVFLWDAAPWEPEAIVLAAAADGGRDTAISAARRLMSLYARRAAGRTQPLPLDGDTLMRELGLEPGPTLGRALHEARLAWEAGEVRTAGEALSVARGAAIRD